jgi:hypothetical protein
MKNLKKIIKVKMNCNKMDQKLKRKLKNLKKSEFVNFKFKNNLLTYFFT